MQLEMFGPEMMSYDEARAVAPRRGARRYDDAGYVDMWTDDAGARLEEAHPRGSAVVAALWRDGDYVQGWRERGGVLLPCTMVEYAHGWGQR